MDKINPSDLKHAQKSTNESQGKTSSKHGALISPEQSRTAREQRYRDISTLIQKARAACNQDTLDLNGAVMKLQTTVWAEALADVPSRFLNDCYLEAVKAHNTSFPLGVGEIANVWRVHGEMWAKAEAPPVLTEDYCETCSGTGWAPVYDADLNSKGVRRCTVCR